MDRKRRGPGESQQYQKHPRSLRGREIGLWYCRQSLERKKREENGQRKASATVVLPPRRLQKIRSLMNTLDAAEEHSDSTCRQQHFLATRSVNILDDFATASTLQRIEKLDELFSNELNAKRTSIQYRRMQQQRERLPAFKMRLLLLDAIDRNQVVLISGETGCGKTTQVPQFILDQHLEAKRGSMCRIVCSQPRRISAISVAQRVAAERGESLGDSIGYQIRLESRPARDRGSITFCTTGVILKRMESNAFLDDVTHLILDEIHERDMTTDMILAVLKLILTHWTHLKVILMSATMNADRFASYFDTSSRIHIPGYTFDVETFYLEDVLLRTGFTYPPVKRKRRFQNHKDFVNSTLPLMHKLEKDVYPASVCRELMNPASEENNLELILQLLKDLCKQEPEGAILVFLTGYVEIAKLNELMEASNEFPRTKFLTIPLHSQMATAQQGSIFQPPPSGVRKIVLSTNIAETSITIEDVVYVIDCGRIKINDFNSTCNEETLKAQWVSKANANQRRGRAGRVRAGKCFHMITRLRYAQLEDQQKPELLRMRLEGVVLMLKILRVGDANAFLQTCLDVPPEESIVKAIALLKRMNALDEDELLTPLGYHLASLPVAPQLGKMMLMGSIFGCVEPVINIACALDFKDAFLMPLGMEEVCRRRKLDLSQNSHSDHILFHNAMLQYETSSNPKQFCWNHFLSEQIMKQLGQMKKQFADILFKLNFTHSACPKAASLNVHSNNESLIKAMMCAGLYPNVLINKVRARKRNTFATLHTLRGKKVDLHPKSIAPRHGPFESPFVVYYRKVRSTCDFAYDVSSVHCLPLLFFGEQFKCFVQDGIMHISIDDSLTFASNEETANIIGELRTRLNRFLERRACKPQPVNWQHTKEVSILKAIVELITTEEILENIR